jgi:hypothetical protein
MMGVRLATAGDLDWIKAMADRHRRELGFVLRPALADGIARGEVLVGDGGFCHYHRRRDDWHTVYELVSERPGTGSALLAAVPRPVRLKCPAGLAANGFYSRQGGVLVAVQPGVLRPLNVWEWAS